MDPEIYLILINTLVKFPGIVSPPHFIYDFPRKIFLMLHSINWRNFIV